MSHDASQEAARGFRDQCTIAGDEEFESSITVVPRRAGELACDQGPARVRAECDDDPLLAQRVSRLQLDAAYATAQIGGHVAAQDADQRRRRRQILVEVSRFVGEVLRSLQCRQHHQHGEREPFP